MTFSPKQFDKVDVLGIDGLPFSLLTSKMREGRFPNFQHLLAEGELARMTSSVPPVSSVAWTCIATGRNPAGHGIFGFIDRKPASLDMFIPTAADRRAPALWDILAKHGRRSIVLNVPCTYPPSIENGIMAGCFLSPDIDRAVFPPEYVPRFKDLGYVIDVDPWKARTAPDAFLDDLFAALDARLRTTLDLMHSEPWDLFFSHIMETDRLFHFFWEQWETGVQPYAGRFERFLDAVDDFVGQVRASLPERTALVALSDHGFCTLRKEVFLNHALHEAGFISYTGEGGKELTCLAPETVAYSMIPGRIYINLRGREKNGSVSPGAAYEDARRRVAEFLAALTDPEDGTPIIDKVFMREEVYSGSEMDSAPDLVALPRDGYDLKGAVRPESLFAKKEITGMHTRCDAIMYVSGCLIESDSPDVADAAPSILSLLGIDAEGMDGKAVFA